jgi:hypothetical protein
MTIVPGRACGGCTVCCTELHINTPGLKKLAGVRCPNLRDDCLCAIYETRPRTCSDFECGWRMTAALGEHWRPDRAGIVLIPKTKDNPPGYMANSGVQIVLLRPDALRNPELPGLIAQWVEARVPLYLTIAAPVGFIAPSAFLNETVVDTVRRKDRDGLVKALEELARDLARRAPVAADFSRMPEH